MRVDAGQREQGTESYAEKMSHSAPKIATMYQMPGCSTVALYEGSDVTLWKEHRGASAPMRSVHQPIAARMNLNAFTPP